MSAFASDPVKLGAAGLATVGALNWGLVGLFKMDLVAAAFGQGSLLARATYATVGVAGAYVGWTLVQEWLREEIGGEASVQAHMARIERRPGLPVAPWARPAGAAPLA